MPFPMEKKQIKKSSTVTNADVVGKCQDSTNKSSTTKISQSEEKNKRDAQNIKESDA